MAWKNRCPAVTGLYWFQDFIAADAVVIVEVIQAVDRPLVMFIGSKEAVPADELSGQWWDQRIEPPPAT